MRIRAGDFRDDVTAVRNEQSLVRNWRENLAVAGMLDRIKNSGHRHSCSDFQRLQLLCLIDRLFCTNDE